MIIIIVSIMIIIVISIITMVIAVIRHPRCGSNWRSRGYHHFYSITIFMIMIITIINDNDNDSEISWQGEVISLKGGIISKLFGDKAWNSKRDFSFQ